ncbi:MAG TPA: hypothetical protein VII87_00085 [Solirubrobacteraceae bacterium]
MTEHEASRTLVKSTPELWAECSDAASLARHLGAFGEIRITKLEPETAVAWEGEDVRGTVTLEPSGWGTRVILTAVSQVAPEPAIDVEPERAAAPGPEPEALLPGPEPEALVPGLEPELDAASQVRAVAEPASEPEPEPEPESTPRVGFLRRLFGGRQPPESAPAESPEAPQPSDPGVARPVLAEREAPVELTPTPAPTPTPATDRQTGPSAALVEALDSLGQAHKRPFSHG